MKNFTDFFSNGEYVLMTIKIVIGAVTAFFAIIAWQRTRRLSTMFFIVGVLTLYIKIIYNALLQMGVVNIYEFAIQGVSIGIIISELVPLIAFMLSLLLYLRESKG